MNSIRRHLRLWAAAWLICQAASLSALVPRECCAAHRPAAEPAHGCQKGAVATHCPMRGPDGTPCPMHRGGDSADTQRQAANACVLRGTCDGPMAAMVALLSQCGVLANSFSMALPDLDARSAITYPGDNPLSRLAPPDPPPPRA